MILTEKVTVTLEQKIWRSERVNHAKKQGNSIPGRGASQVQRPWAENVPNILKQ